MTIDRNTMVGAFVLGGVALVATAVVMFGNFSLFSRTIQAAVVFQDAINGLAVGAPVTFRGVPIGSVDAISISYDPATNTAYIPVTIRLESGRTSITPIEPGSGAFVVPELVKRGLRAQLQFQSYVTGQAQIDLDFDPKSPMTLHPDVTQLPEIPTRPSAFQRAREQLQDLPLHDLAVNANAALESFRRLADQLDRDLPPLVTSLKTTSDRSVATVESAAKAMEAATEAIRDLQGRIDSTLSAIATAAVTGDQQLKQRGAELGALLTNANQAMTQARQVVGEVKAMTSARGNTRQNIDAVLRDLAAASSSLRGLAADLERNPQLLVTGRGRGQ